MAGEALGIAGGFFRGLGALLVLFGFLLEYAAWTAGLGALILNRFSPAPGASPPPGLPALPPVPAPPPAPAPAAPAGATAAPSSADRSSRRRLRERKRRMRIGTSAEHGDHYSKRTDSSRATTCSSQASTVPAGPVSLKKYGPAGVSTTAAFRWNSGLW